MTPSLKYIANELHEILCSNRYDFNLAGVNFSKLVNHCTVLIYYAGDKLKENPSLGYYTDCVYYVSDGKYVEEPNSQVDNTLALIYSLDHSRKLNLKNRHMSVTSKGGNFWVDDKGSR